MKVLKKTAPQQGLIYDPDKKETTPFFIYGGNINLGPDSGFIDFTKSTFSDGDPKVINMSYTVYGVQTHNVNNVATDYSGVFYNEGATAALGYGGSYGTGVNPSEIGVPANKRERAYSTTVGFTTGYALTVSAGYSNYVPLPTCSFANCQSNNTLQFLWDSITGN